jgi:hypothetical protein
MWRGYMSLFDINGRIMSFVEEDVVSRAETKFVVFASAQKFLQNHFSKLSR